jgi:hypothetical protein
VLEVGLGLEIGLRLELKEEEEKADFKECCEMVNKED